MDRRASFPAAVLSCVIACGPEVGAPQSDEDSGSDTGSTTPASTTTTTTTTTTTNGSDPTATTSGSDFVPPTDIGEVTDCDMWTGEPCPAGYKCMPYANDGGNAWNATRCSPIAPDPGAPDDSCTVEGNAVSGVDDCEAFSMCLYVDEQTDMGTCVAFCQGSPENPTCADACQRCWISSGPLALCLAACDPLLQNCGMGKACLPIADGFSCFPDASGEMGNAGDPCEFLNACDPGLFCANADVVEGCEGSQGCCAPFCSLGSSDPCPGLSPDVECVPWWEQPPPPNECFSTEVGVCVIPR